jgi:hypothetical protein
MKRLWNCIKRMFGIKTTDRSRKWYKIKNQWYRYQKGNYQPEIKEYTGVSKAGMYSFNYWYYNNLN